MNNGGVLWSTDFPYIEKPILKTSFTNIKYRRELCMSDWCADPSNIKVGNIIYRYYKYIVYLYFYIIIY